MSERPALIEPDWPAPPEVMAFTSTRAGGVSTGVFESLNLGAHCGDSEAAVAHNRRVIAGELPDNRPVVWLNQVHDTQVYSALDAQNEPEADASVDRNGHFACAVLTADCLPVLLCADDGTVVAAAHAGWRGLLKGVIEATTGAMGIAPGRLLAWLGPAIAQDAFEVGPEVRGAFLAKHPSVEYAFTPGRGDRWHASLNSIARSLLSSLGVTRIYGGDWCTYTDERFYSYRRDGRTGRMASVITRLPRA